MSTRRGDSRDPPRFDARIHHGENRSRLSRNSSKILHFATVTYFAIGRT